MRTPRLSALLQICAGLGTIPLELLTGCAASTDGCITDTEGIHRAIGRRRKVPSSVDDVLRSLEAVLLSEEKPTLNKVAKDLGFSCTCKIYGYGSVDTVGERLKQQEQQSETYGFC